MAIIFVERRKRKLSITINIVVLCVALIIFLFLGFMLGAAIPRKRESVGRIVIDNVNGKETWVWLFDKGVPLSEVAESDYVWMEIDKRI